MPKLLTQLLNLIFPPRPTEKLIQESTTEDIMKLYSPGTFQSCIYLSSYKTPLIQACVIENKFHNNKRSTELLAQILLQWTKHQILPTLYIAIPLGKNRLRERGYNQVENILDALDNNICIDSSILCRIKETEPQSKLDKDSRTKNIQCAFAYKNEKVDLSQYDQIVIIDDVLTTGATLEEARGTLAPHVPSGGKLRCLAIAH